MKKIVFSTISVLVLASFAFSQAKADRDVKRLQQQLKTRGDGGTQCGSDPILPTDGSSVQDYINNVGSNYYLLHLKTGHSYVAEMWDPADTFIGGGAQLMLLSSPGCTPLTTTNVVGVDPDLSNNFADRISWIQTTDSDAVLQATSLDASGAFYTYVIRVVDTTLINPYWTSNSPLAIQYVFHNTTRTSLHGKLAVYDLTAGGAPYTESVTVPATGQLIRIVASTGIASSNFHVAANHQGRASFQFYGPAGAIIVEADFINSATPGVPVAPSKFEPKFLAH